MPYNCLIQSNSENVHLTWRVTLPGQNPINITYDVGSVRGNIDPLNTFITTSLSQYVSDEHIESVLMLTVQDVVVTNQTKVECIIGDLGNEASIIFINSSGTVITVELKAKFILYLFL